MTPAPTLSSPHLQTQDSVARLMLRVILAMVPGILAYFAFFGWGVWINLALAVVTALAGEALMLRLRGRALRPFLSDGSAVVTAMLLAVSIPPLAPWWLVVLGTAFAIIIAKHLYGGLGFNPFNPAMVGYIMLLISFPREMTAWLAPMLPEMATLGLAEHLRYAFSGVLPAGLSYDTLTMATPLDTLKTQIGLNRTVSEIVEGHALFGGVGGRGWEWVNAMFLLGGLYLLYTRSIAWQIPAAFLGTLFALSMLFFLSDPDTHASPLFHLFSGGTMLAAFFIATDPITASTTPRGRLYYAAGIGILVFVIRNWGGYPDGIAFAVLLMNMAVPTLDYYTQPRVFGHRRGD